uniref:hypothetical protein n=1 Tax=Gemmiger formicilis TaxID=745368 RepID=UPI003FEE77B6
MWYLQPIGWFVGNGLDRSVCLAKSTTRRENCAPFGAILCAARGQMCGWVKTHPYKHPGNRLFLHATPPFDKGGSFFCSQTLLNLL